MRLILFFTLSLVSLYSAPVDISHTDLIPRVINFVIFCIILWLLLSKKIRTFLSNRSNLISHQLSEIQDRLKVAKSEKERALVRLQEAKESANNILAVGKKESYLVAQKIEDQFGNDVELMRRNAEAFMELERRRMYREVISEVLDEVFVDVQLSSEDYARILHRRIS